MLTEGLKFRVTADELRAHCKLRSDHYFTRSQQKGGDLDSGQFNRAMSDAFEFMAEHFFDGDYSLTDRELLQLEFVKSP